MQFANSSHGVGVPGVPVFVERIRDTVRPNGRFLLAQTRYANRMSRAFAFSFDFWFYAIPSWDSGERPVHA